jgi:hypothetical protein
MIVSPREMVTLIFSHAGLERPFGADERKYIHISLTTEDAAKRISRSVSALLAKIS